MSKRAWVYIWSVFILGTLATGYALWTWEPARSPWSVFGVLIVLATVAQLLRVEAPTHQLYYATLAFQFAGLLLLPPFLFVLLIAIPYLIQWAKERLTHSRHLTKWYLQPFNISNHIFTGFLAYNIYRWIVFLSASPTDSLPVMLISLLTAGVYVLVNHTVVGFALMLARKVPLRESGILEPQSLLNDYILACLGIAVAVLWQVESWFIIPALSSLVLMYQALKIPLLQKVAQTDEKTGLFNSRHFSIAFSAELQRAKRFSRPLSFIMSDLDLLRNVNNTYGHLAGDMVLHRIGKVIRETIREYDIAGRFGGEEFSIALPETNISEAQVIAERVRQIVAETPFEIPPHPTPIHVTMSFGVAMFPQDAFTPNDLIHQADLAVYQAKLQGRNRVVLSSDVPHSAKLESEAMEDRLAPPSYPIVAREFPVPQTTEASVPLPVAQVAEPPARSSKTLGQWFVAVVIGLGGMTALYGFWQSAPDWNSIIVLAMLAIAAELFQVRLYGDSTVSVSATINFAAALIVGIPGVVLVSLAIVATHFVRNRHVPVYKTAFNWATHVLAAAVPAHALRWFGLAVSMDYFYPLILFTGGMSIVYYLVESGLVTIAIGLFENKTVLATWRQEFKWMAAFYIALGLMGLFMALIFLDKHIGMLGILTFLMPLAILYYAQQQYVERTKDSVNELSRMNQELVNANRQVVAANQAIYKLNDELFLTLAKIIDARDPFVLGHATQVAEYATTLARQLNLAPARLDNVRRAALLHDIGKIGISERVLHKPNKLSVEEYAFVKKHAELGADFLETAQGLRHLVLFIRHHHEWWNGKGYPAGLAGEQIPLEARILAVCDAVEAMASDRAYHRAMSLAEIIRELKACSGMQFDPTVVEAFVQVAEREGVTLVINSARGVAEKYPGDLRGMYAESLDGGIFPSPQTGLAPAG